MPALVFIIDINTGYHVISLNYSYIMSVLNHTGDILWWVLANLPWTTTNFFFSCWVMRTCSHFGKNTHNEGKQHPDCFLPMIRQWSTQNGRHKCPLFPSGDETCVRRDPVLSQSTPPHHHWWTLPYPPPADCRLLLGFHHCSQDMLTVLCWKQIELTHWHPWSNWCNPQHGWKRASWCVNGAFLIIQSTEADLILLIV